MSETKKQRQMSPKGFLQKANSAKSALGFLQAYRQYMTTGELASTLSPILFKVDVGQLMPTPAVDLIAQAVMEHIIAADQKRFDESIEKATTPAAKKPWVVSIYDSKGNLCVRVKDDGEEEELVKEFDHAAQGDRWADLRLFEQAAGAYAVVEGFGTQVIIHRQDAMARILAKKKSAVCRTKGKSTKTLGWVAKMKQDRSSFSRG